MKKIFVLVHTWRDGQQIELFKTKSNAMRWAMDIKKDYIKSGYSTNQIHNTEIGFLITSEDISIEVFAKTPQ